MASFTRCIGIAFVALILSVAINIPSFLLLWVATEDGNFPLQLFSYGLILVLSLSVLVWVILEEVEGRL